MNLQKIIAVLLISYLLFDLCIVIYHFNIPFWLRYGIDLTDPFELSQIGIELWHYSVLIVFIYALIMLITSKKLELNGPFNYLMVYFYSINIFLLIISSLSTELNFFTYNENATWVVYAMLPFRISLLILIPIYYYKKQKNTASENIVKVSKFSRFLNRLIDMLFVMTFAFAHIRRLRHGFIFEEIPFLNNNPVWYFAIYFILYYFILELIFLQTLGKTRNNSFVHCEYGRLKSILIRTLCRFIPFDALSYFGSNGWHDYISDTSVVKENKSNETLDHLVIEQNNI